MSDPGADNRPIVFEESRFADAHTFPLHVRPCKAVRRLGRFGQSTTHVHFRSDGSSKIMFDFFDSWIPIQA
jgi:hypothetical protein